MLSTDSCGGRSYPLQPQFISDYGYPWVRRAVFLDALLASDGARRGLGLCSIRTVAWLRARSAAITTRAVQRTGRANGAATEMQ